MHYVGPGCLIHCHKLSSEIIFSIMLTKLKRIIELWRYLTYSPQKYAKYIGVNMGADNFIADKGCWPSVPYLITIGSHCQITHGVRLFTHGGPMWCGKYIQILIFLEK